MPKVAILPMPEHDEQILADDHMAAHDSFALIRPSSPNCLSERGPMMRQAVNYLVAEIGKRAKLRFHVHPHMLRHSTGITWPIAAMTRDWCRII
jgi:integrase